MMPFSITAEAAVVLLAGSAAATAGVAVVARPDFLSLPVLLWFAANLIVLALWALSSSPPSSSSYTDIPAAIRSLYEQDSDVAALLSRPDITPNQEKSRVAVARSAEEPRIAAAKPISRLDRSWCIDLPSAILETDVAPAATTVHDDINSKLEKPRPADAKPHGDGGGDDESMDSMWRAIMQRGAARPVVKKSATWGDDEVKRLERVAERATARKEMRKSATSKETARVRLRSREVLVMAREELLLRAENLIRNHYANLRLQRQESERRRLLELRSRRSGNGNGNGYIPIRV